MSTCECDLWGHDLCFSFSIFNSLVCGPCPAAHARATPPATATATRQSLPVCASAKVLFAKVRASVPHDGDAGAVGSGGGAMSARRPQPASARVVCAARRAAVQPRARSAHKHAHGAAHTRAVWPIYVCAAPARCAANSLPQPQSPIWIASAPQTSAQKLPSPEPRHKGPTARFTRA